jgi:hypothetical protein
MYISEIKNNTIVLKGAKNPNDSLLDVVSPLPNWNSFAMCLIGGPGSGKSSLVMRLLTKYYKKRFNSIYFFSGSLNTLPDEFLDKLDPNKVFGNLNKLPKIIDIINSTNDKTLIVIDDLVADIQDKQKKNNIMNLIYNRRHIGGGVSIMLISQKLRAIDLKIRTGLDTCIFFSLNNKRELEAAYEDFVEDLTPDEWFALVKYVKNKNKVADHPFIFMDKRNGKYYNKFNLLTIKRDESDTEGDT